MFRMEIQQKNIVIASTAAIVFLTTTVGILILRRRKNNKSKTTVVDGIARPVKEIKKKLKVNEMLPPSEWLQIGTVSGLRIYPMKSGRSVNLTKAEATELGLQEISRKGTLPLRDRVFVVYRESDKNFVSNKTYNKMFKLTVNSLSTNSVELSYEKDKIIIKIPEYNGENNIIMRKENVPTIDCGDEVSVWISKILLNKDKGLRVGYWPDVSRRDVSDVFTDYMRLYENMCNDFTGAYADIGSYLIVNQGSIDDLNLKINDSKNRITAENFRPNIIVDGAVPYSEDKWEWIKIGDEAIFRTFKPCTRCSVTTINPETLEKSSTHEPIKTLKSYRLLPTEEERKVEGDSPMMGMYMGIHTKGRIKYGDPIYINPV